MNKATAVPDLSDSSSSMSDKRLDGESLHSKRTYEDDHVSSHTNGTVPSNAQGGKASKRTKRRQQADDDSTSPMTFPQRLMEVLEDPSLSSIISWLPHGRSFAILDKKKFSKEVMGRYLKQLKFTSFTRKLNRWGFERVAKGPEAGAYYHPLFLRNNLNLCLRMMCQKNRVPQKDGSVASATTAEGPDVNGSTASSVASLPERKSSQAKASEKEIPKTQTQSFGDRQSHDDSQARDVEAGINGIEGLTSSQLLQLERMRQMLQLQSSSNHDANEATQEQRIADVNASGRALSAAQKARHQQQQQQELGDLHQRLEQAQAEQQSALGARLEALGLPNNDAGLRHLQLLQQHLMANQGSAEAALLQRSNALGNMGFQAPNESALGGLHHWQQPHLSALLAQQNQGRAQQEQMEEMRQRLLLRQQIEMAQQSQYSLGGHPFGAQSYLWGLQQASMGNAMSSNHRTDNGGASAQENAQRQLQEHFGAQEILRQETLNNQQQQQRLQQQQQQQQQQDQQQMDPLMMQLVQQAMSGQLDPALLSRFRHQG